MRPNEFFEEVKDTFSDTLYCGIIHEDEIFYEDAVAEIDKEAHESIVMRLYFLATDPEKEIEYFITQYEQDKYLYIKKVNSTSWIFIFSANKSFAKLHFFVQFILSEDEFELGDVVGSTHALNPNKDKILSARRIQELLLPNLDESLSQFSKHHLWYQPMDIVGGDFYWTRKTKEYLWVVVGDCTGHSVEGALASVSVMSILNQVFDSSEKPHLLIKALHRSLDDLQEQKLDQGYGIGCEMIALRFDLKNKELDYSGTGLPLYQFTDGKVKRYKTKKSALNPERVVKYLRSRKLYLNPADGFFTHSDGLVDQINLGGKKIQSRKVLELLKEQQTVDDTVTKDMVSKHLNGQRMIDDAVTLFMKI